MTCGLGTPNTDNWTGSRNTAPETPTGLVMVAMTKPARNPNRSRSKAHPSVSWRILSGGLHLSRGERVALSGESSRAQSSCPSGFAGGSRPGVSRAPRAR